MALLLQLAVEFLLHAVSCATSNSSQRDSSARIELVFLLSEGCYNLANPPRCALPLAYNTSSRLLSACSNLGPFISA